MNEMIRKAMEDLFRCKDVVVKVSMIEIYNEHFIDLLNGEKDPKTHVEVVIDSIEDFKKIYDKGVKKRRTAKTKMNDSSSRSHSIRRVSVESTRHDDNKRVVATLNLVD